MVTLTAHLTTGNTSSTWDTKHPQYWTWEKKENVAISYKIGQYYLRFNGLYIAENEFKSFIFLLLFYRFI